MGPGRFRFPPGVPPGPAVRGHVARASRGSDVTARREGHGARGAMAAAGGCRVSGDTGTGTEGRGLLGPAGTASDAAGPEPPVPPCPQGPGSGSSRCGHPAPAPRPAPRSLLPPGPGASSGAVPRDLELSRRLQPDHPRLSGPPRVPSLSRGSIRGDFPVSGGGCTGSVTRRGLDESFVPRV